jgi:hypothetical protein
MVVLRLTMGMVESRGKDADPPALLLQADPGAVGPAPAVGAPERRGRRPRREHQVRHREVRRRHGLLERPDLGLADEVVGDRREILS